ncbi:MAG: HEAT repeat domain-containing protein [Myxococcota bacterium]|nr:HEAT repeat domain-containing protein [Myxococcota bacterium]
MPRETIRKLSESTERLLVAGAHLAQGSAELARDQAALQALIAKLGAKSPPVFAKLCEQIDKTVHAKPKEQASELISLATSIAQVRAGLAQLAPTSGDAPIARGPEVQTECNAKDLYALHDAMVTTGQGRMEKVDEAIERGDIADLRLVHAAIQAMGDSYLGAKIADAVVPRFGRAVVEPIRAKLRFPGTKIDARRLRALVAVEKSDALALVEQALREGSADLRAGAFDAVADHLPGVPALEPLALSNLEKERSGEVRRAAVRALAGYGSDASLEKLLEALDDERTVREAAEALGRSKHPQVVDRLLDRLAVAVAAGAAKVKKGDKDAEKTRDAARALAQRLLGALGGHADPRIPGVARELLEPYGATAAAAVIAHGTLDDVRSIADLLTGTRPELFRIAVVATLKLPAPEILERLLPLITPSTHKLDEQRLDALRAGFVALSDERWVSALIDVVRTTPRPPAAVFLLGLTKSPRAVEPLIAVLEAEKAGDRAPDVLHAIMALGDRRALPAVLARFGGRSGRYDWLSMRCVLGLADETTVDQVRAIYAGLENRDSGANWYVQSLLRSLERRFPGH